MRVLDIDLDYFMTVVGSDIPSSCKNRYPEDNYGDIVWATHRVIDFFENHLGLREDHKIPGRIVTGHNESLIYWRELIDEGRLSDPFEVVHVDSHPDLGLGYVDVCDFLQGAFLTLPVDVRRKVTSTDKGKEIDIGDYLLWAVAYQMVSKITYCSNPEDKGSAMNYPVDILKDFHENYVYDKPVSNWIQLKYNPNMGIPVGSFYDEMEALKERYLSGVTIKDPEVELLTIPTVEGVHFDGDFDFAVMAQSPNYTPESADYILDILREYIDEV